MSALPVQPERCDGPQCSRCGAPRVAFPAGGHAVIPLPQGLRICIRCDMGAPYAGPPVLLDYIRRGHRA